MIPLQMPPAWPVDSRWPHWFLAAIWVWQQSLTWPPPGAHRLRRGEGITFLELMVNFIVTTATLPPVRGEDQTALCNPLWSEGIMLPLVQRDLISNFVSALLFLTKATGVKVLGVPRHHRIFTLVALGETQPRKGVQRRPMMQNEEATAHLLVQHLRSGCTESLRDWALRHD